MKARIAAAEIPDHITSALEWVATWPSHIHRYTPGPSFPDDKGEFKVRWDKIEGSSLTPLALDKGQIEILLWSIGKGEDRAQTLHRVFGGAADEVALGGLILELGSGFEGRIDAEVTFVLPDLRDR